MYSLSTMTGTQQVSRSRQCSRRRCGRVLRIDQIVDTTRSRMGVGTQLYIPRLLEIVERRPVYVRLALWFLHHPAWMESHTGGSRLTPTVHRCPKGEAVGGLCMSPIHDSKTRNPYKVVSSHRFVSRCFLLALSGGSFLFSLSVGSFLFSLSKGFSPLCHSLSVGVFAFLLFVCRLFSFLFLVRRFFFKKISLSFSVSFLFLLPFFCRFFLFSLLLFQ